MCQGFLWTLSLRCGPTAWMEVWKEQRVCPIQEATPMFVETGLGSVSAGLPHGYNEKKGLPEPNAPGAVGVES